MSLFSDILAGADGVYTVTNRPDLVVETKLAIRQATLAAHRCEKWKKDMDEIFLPLTSASSFQLDTSVYLPSFKQIAYIRPYDSVSQSPANFILAGENEVAPDAIFDEYGAEKVNTWYIAGTSLNIRLQAAYNSFLIGYYKNPVLLPEGAYESWIAREQPAVIVIDAARRVLEMIGYQEAAARLKIMLFGEMPGSSASNPSGGEYMLLKQSNVEGFGR